MFPKGGKAVAEIQLDRMFLGKTWPGAAVETRHGVAVPMAQHTGHVAAAVIARLHGEDLLPRAER